MKRALQQRIVTSPIALTGSILGALGGAYLLVGLGFLCWELIAGMAWIVGLSFFCTGFLLSLVGGFCLFLGKTHPSALLVQHYYQALADQDYGVAAQDLSPQVATPAKEQLSAEDILQQERALDAAYGQISDWRITNSAMVVRAWASYTVKVTRGNHVERVHPYLVRQGPAWKIVGFTQRQVNPR